MLETDLYAPLKAYLQAQGYDVKGEIGALDLTAVRGDEPPVIVEIKTSFTLSLVLQGIDRQKLSDAVYLAVPPFTGRTARSRRRDVLGLCRRLGLGLMFVRATPPAVEVLADPGPYRPRKQKARLGRLLGEFERRVGDPSPGGTTTRSPRMTAYRQDALRCARFLAGAGPSKAANVAAETGVPKAATLLHRNVYGWFDRVARGIYTLSPAGVAALETHRETLAKLPE